MPIYVRISIGDNSEYKWDIYMHFGIIKNERAPYIIKYKLIDILKLFMVSVILCIVYVEIEWKRI